MPISVAKNGMKSKPLPESRLDFKELAMELVAIPAVLAALIYGDPRLIKSSSGEE